MFLERTGIDNAAWFDLEHAVGEALANAVEHGYKENTFFEIRCRFTGKQLLIEIEDNGPGFEREKILQGPGLRGFGFTLMHSLVDRLTVLKRGRLVRLEKRVTALRTETPRTERRDNETEFV
jgi:anti-sigma regulatory factor (Ser/Thr protein kinase)